MLDHLIKNLEVMEEEKKILTLFTDLAKAFDKCDHEVITHKVCVEGDNWEAVMLIL